MNHRSNAPNAFGVSTHYLDNRGASRRVLEDPRSTCAALPKKSFGSTARQYEAPARDKFGVAVARTHAAFNDTMNARVH